MAGSSKKFVVQGTQVKCSLGTTMCKLDTDVGHGLQYQGKPILNANDHIPMINITPFGACGNKPCVLTTPLAWQFCHDTLMVDGAPALTTDSLCMCMLGGVISIVDGAGVMGPEEEEAFVKMMMENYGFDEEQARLILKAYNVFMKDASNQNLPREEQIHKFFANMAGLCINYSGGSWRWKFACDTPATTDAMEYFEKLGLSKQEVFDLMGAINFQHSGGELLSKPIYYNSQGFCSNPNCNRGCEYKYHITDSKYWKFDYSNCVQKKDFAHELIQYAGFSNNNWFKNVWNAFEPMMGSLSSLTSYKGDVYSKNMEIDDMNSDMDAVNTYGLFLKNPNKSILQVIMDYNTDVTTGKINRAEEFLKVLGEGNAQKGYKALEDELNKAEYGAIFIDSGLKGIVQDILYTDAMVSSGVVMMGQDTFEEVMELSPGKQVENKKEISDTRQEFLKHVRDEWEKANE